MTRSTRLSTKSCSLIAAATLAVAGAIVAGAAFSPPATTSRLAAATTPPAAAAASTAWHDGTFSIDTPNVVRQADVVLGQPNRAAAQSMPLGNGSLGAAVWAAGGFTAQLNRADTLPGRLSPGQIQIPGLAAMTSAPNFYGYLDLYNGVLHESGGGMSATIYVRADKDELVVSVTGATPGTPETALLHLWPGRTPSAQASGPLGTLSQTWTDSATVTGSGQTFGALAGITAGGQNVTASVVSPTEVQVSFTPHSDGSFTVLAAAPQYAGGNAISAAWSVFGGDAFASQSSLQAAHLAWWHHYWSSIGLVKLSSPDGSANYLQNIRTLYYFTEAEDRGTQFPGSQAGVAGLFNFSGDHQDWYPASYWFWNLRGQVAANIGAGAFSLNTPVFSLYTSNLPSIEAWTKANMGGLPGICVPETMRFNGTGFMNDTAPYSDANCDQNIAPTYNGETISTGAEIGLWVWQEYETTGNLSFLQANYPLMSQASRFLLGYATKSPDGLLHTVANAHENQWDVTDPVNVIAAMSALFPAAIQAAQTLGIDQRLVSQLETAETEIPPLPRTDGATHTQLLSPAADSAGTDVIGTSSQPAAPVHNTENDDLEPVWPYGLIGDQGPLTALAQRTYSDRVDKLTPDWSFDAVDAARLGLSSQVASDLVSLTEAYQAYPDGLGSWKGGLGDEPYLEQPANVALAINESLVQDYDGLLRIAPALPSGWDADAVQYIHGGSTVAVQVHGGAISTVAITAGSTGSIEIRSPWPGQQAEVVDGGDESAVVVSPPTTASQFAIPVIAGSTYLVQLASAPVSALPVAAVTGTPATTASHLGAASTGIAPAPGASPVGQITGISHLCAGSNSGLGASGTAVQAQICGGAAGQTWTVASGNTLQAMGQCLDVTGASAASGTQVELWTCNGGTNQEWRLHPNGELVGTGSGKCLDDSYSGGAGTGLIIDTCTDAPSQQWALP